jgi:hypothetical protein
MRFIGETILRENESVVSNIRGIIRLMSEGRISGVSIQGKRDVSMRRCVTVDLVRQQYISVDSGA